MQIAKLRELFDANETSRAIHQELLTRQRNRNETDLSRLRLKLRSLGIVPNDRDWNMTWKMLQVLGVGVVEHGPRGAYKRFMWTVAQIDVAKLGTPSHRQQELAVPSEVVYVLRDGKLVETTLDDLIKKVA